MKKILLIFTLMISILPATSVFAADPIPVSSGINFYQNDGSTPVSNWTNGNLTDYYLLRSDSPYGPYTLTFPQPTDLTAIRVYTEYSVETNFNYRAYNAVGTQLYNLTVAGGTPTPATKTVDFKGVSKISISVTNNTNVREIQLFGQQAPIVNTEKDKFVINNFSVTPASTTSVNLSWDAVSSQFFSGYRVYVDGQLKANVTNTMYPVSGLVSGEAHTFAVSAFDVNGDEYAKATKAYTIPLPDTTPPPSPTSVTVSPDRYTAIVNAAPVSADDLAGYLVFLDGTRVTPSAVTLPYTLVGLQLDSDYKVSVASIDSSGNISPQSDQKSFKTLSVQTAPAKPVSLSATAYNGSVSLSWLPSSSAKEYNVYVNGVKKLTVSASSAKISGLTNGTQYTFSVDAVNDVGSSSRSDVVTATPSAEFVPDVSLGYQLKDVADGVGSWFSSYWLILAFSIAIPLSFYVGNRIKGLFA